jgi:hypothetical protein
MCFPRIATAAGSTELLQLRVGKQLCVRGVETKPPHTRQRHSRARAVIAIRIVHHVLSQCLDAQPQLTSRRAQTACSSRHVSNRSTAVPLCC